MNPYKKLAEAAELQAKSHELAASAARLRAEAYRELADDGESAISSKESLIDRPGEDPVEVALRVLDDGGSLRQASRDSGIPFSTLRRRILRSDPKVIQTRSADHPRIKADHDLQDSDLLQISNSSTSSNKKFREDHDHYDPEGDPRGDPDRISGSVDQDTASEDVSPSPAFTEVDPLTEIGIPYKTSSRRTSIAGYEKLSRLEISIMESRGYSREEIEYALRQMRSVALEGAKSRYVQANVKNQVYVWMDRHRKNGWGPHSRRNQPAHPSGKPENKI